MIKKVITRESVMKDIQNVRNPKGEKLNMPEEARKHL